jgi:lysophospholipid acyltransferase (LPLAT)-like uncharacterized protein
MFEMRTNEWLHGLVGLAGATAIRQWMRSLDYKVYYHDPAVDPARRECRGQKIYLFWHEYILFPLYLRGHCNLTMLLSRHRDAEYLAKIAYHLGFECVRGSTYRGAATALRQLCRRSRSMHLTITPDGPRGPRRRLAQGPIYLASKLGLPLVVLGLGFDRPWRAGSWDRFAVPRPCSRARAVVGREIFVPPNIDRQATERYRSYVETILNRLTEQAERWAESRRRLSGQVATGKQTSPLPLRVASGPWHMLPRPAYKDFDRAA